MPIIPVALSPTLAQCLAGMVKAGVGKNKVEVIRRAIAFLAKDQAIRDVHESVRAYKAGKVYRGKLSRFVKK